jgi:hypothetical protein
LGGIEQLFSILQQKATASNTRLQNTLSILLQQSSMKTRITFFDFTAGGQKVISRFHALKTKKIKSIQIKKQLW